MTETLRVCGRCGRTAPLLDNSKCDCSCHCARSESPSPEGLTEALGEAIFRAGIGWRKDGPEALDAMTRCIHCHHRIWPWQHRGWRIGEGYWHGLRCYRGV